MEPTTNQQQGTSLDILSIYLMHGIEVEVIDPYGGAGERHKLRAIDPALHFPVLCGKYGDGMECATFGILPVLRPFSALCLPLEDGTIPAETIIDMLGNSHFKAGMVKQLFIHDDSLWMKTDGQLYGCETVDRPGPAKAHIWGEETKPAIIDYLRRHHFAVGLEPHQFIPLLP